MLKVRTLPLSKLVARVTDIYLESTLGSNQITYIYATAYISCPLILLLILTITVLTAMLWLNMW